MTQPNTTPAHVGALLCRAVVPIWVLTGAIFKLFEATPTNLPSEIVRNAKIAGVDLHVLLATFIALEVLAAAVMFFVTRFARAAAIFMLSVFCVVLINEMAHGNVTKCGCLGDVPMTPWQMLLIDGTLLAGVIALRPRKIELLGEPRWGVVAAAALALVGAGVAFGRIMGQPEHLPLTQPDENGAADGTAPAPRLPNSYVSNVGPWIGKRWQEIDIFQFMPMQPTIAATGVHYVVFYSRTCEHCQEMFEQDFTRPLPGPVTAIEIPASRTAMTSPGAWAMPWATTPPANLELLELPLGPDYVITSPIAVRVEDGVVTCAEEGSHKGCLNF